MAFEFVYGFAHFSPEVERSRPVAIFPPFRDFLTLRGAEGKEKRLETKETKRKMSHLSKSVQKKKSHAMKSGSYQCFR